MFICSENLFNFLPIDNVPKSGDVIVGKGHNTEQMHPASILAPSGPNLTDAATGVVAPASPLKTIELQAARIKQLEDTVQQANEVIGVQGNAIKRQEQHIIGQNQIINQQRIQLSARHN